MDTNEAVNQEAEQTVQTESAPVEAEATQAEAKPTESQEQEAQSPTDASNQVEETGKTVPYDRFKEVVDTVNELKGQIASQQPAPVQTPMENEPLPTLDPESQKAVDAAIEAKIEARKASEFILKHEDELKDPLLSGTVKQLLADANSQGKYLDQEQALQNAKDLLDKRIQGQSVKAEKDGFNEGQETALKKEQAGAIGEAKQVPEVDEKTLSASDYALKNNLPRIN